VSLILKAVCRGQFQPESTQCLKRNNASFPLKKKKSGLPLKTISGRSANRIRRRDMPDHAISILITQLLMPPRW
jgi:hypothetical protein